MSAYPKIRVILGLVMIASIGGCASNSVLLPELTGSRVTITRDDSVVGMVENDARETEAGYQITNRQTLWVRVDDERPVTVIQEKVRTEDKQRNTVEIKHRSIVGQNEAVITARIGDSEASVQRQSRKDTRETNIELPAGIRFDNGADLLRRWDFEAMPQLEFYALDVRAPLIERVVYSASETQPSNGERSILRRTFTEDGLRSISRFVLDQAGALIASNQPMFGQNVEATPAAASSLDASSPSNIVRSSTEKSPYRIPRDALDGHMRYTFGTESGLQFQPPQTGEQRVTVTEKGFVLDICDACGPGLDTSEDTLKSALEPTFWLQSDHPFIARIANTVKERDETDTEKMLRLQGLARARMSDISFAGHFSAAEALSRGAGDCTEDAVVLAALGRAAGIPTRVASGIVYSRELYHGVSHSFTAHAWTLAYVDGEWKSFDMSLDGFDASHIALTISDGDPGSIQSGHQLAALLRWDAMTEVKKAPDNNAP